MPRNPYEMDGGRAWKADADKMFTPADAVIVFQNLEKIDLLPPRTEALHIASISSNVPTLEIGVFDALQAQRAGKVTFIAGDLTHLEIGKDDERFKREGFHIVQWDAQHLPLVDHTLHVIYDKKGALWHFAKKEMPQVEFLEILRQLKDKLKPSGIIVIDNFDYNEVDEFFFNDWGFLAGQEQERYMNPYQTEPSTVQTITRTYGEWIWKKISKIFGIIDVGDGIHSVRVLKVKPSIKSLLGV